MTGMKKKTERSTRWGKRRLRTRICGLRTRGGNYWGEVHERNSKKIPTTTQTLSITGIKDFYENIRGIEP
jgi:hypothetical protein